MSNSGLPGDVLKEALRKSRGWLVLFGLFSIVVGFFAIAYPGIMTLALVQVLGMLLVITGVFTVGGVVFGQHKSQPVVTVFLGILRTLAGIGLLIWVQRGVLAVTFLLATFFFLEGALLIGSAIRLRGNRGWWMVLLNGAAALILSLMIYAHFPSDADWALGLLYGINSIFYGTSLLFLAAGATSKIR